MPRFSWVLTFSASSSPLSSRIAWSSMLVYSSKPTASMLPLCSPPRRFPAPRSSRSSAAAALDLELRGAGNLLGGEQSGNIDAVGFEMYTGMLDHAIRELKGEELAEKVSA